MCVELLSYADLGARLQISREAARSLARRRGLPRSRSDQGNALVSVDLSEFRYRPRPRMGRQADQFAAAATARTGVLEPLPLRWNGAPDYCLDAFSSREPVSTSLENALEIEAFKAEIARLKAAAAEARADFDRERERADRLAVEFTQATTELVAANEWAARLEEEVAALRTGGAGGSAAGHAARRLGHLAASIVGADRAARK